MVDGAEPAQIVDSNFHEGVTRYMAWRYFCVSLSRGYFAAHAGELTLISARLQGGKIASIAQHRLPIISVIERQRQERSSQRYQRQWLRNDAVLFAFRFPLRRRRAQTWKVEAHPPSRLLPRHKQCR